MRRVKVYGWGAYVKGEQPTKVEKCEATFHQFGLDYEEFADSTGNYSVAIVEYDDGHVDLIPANLVQFIDKGKE